MVLGKTSQWHFDFRGLISSLGLTVFIKLPSCPGKTDQFILFISPAAERHLDLGAGTGSE